MTLQQIVNLTVYAVGHFSSFAPVNAPASQSPLRSGAVFAGSAMDLIKGDRRPPDVVTPPKGRCRRGRTPVRRAADQDIRCARCPDAVAWLRTMVISGPRAGPELSSAKNSAQHRCVGGPFQGMLQRWF